jgi:hypothetical protein
LDRRKYEKEGKDGKGAHHIVGSLNNIGRVPLKYSKKSGAISKSSVLKTG